MQNCSYCGADLPENSRFCGKCGSVQDAITTDAAAPWSHTPQPQFWAPDGGTLPATWPPYSNYPAQGSAPAWSPHGQAPATPPPPPAAENEDERRRGVPPWSPLYGAALGGDALLGSGQPYTPGAPVVQGTPQIGSVPSVAGSPTPYTNAPFGHPAPGAANAAPFGHPASGAANAPFGHPTQGPVNAPVSHPVQGSGNAPISHPTQGPVNSPVSHPAQGPQPTHHPPEQPGTHEHHQPHGPHRHHTHPAHHEPHRLVKTKAAGSSAVKTILIVVTTVVVVAAGGIGAAAHFLSHPQPLISITSNYKLGNAPAGATGTILQISGQQFSSNSAITFLLDGHIAPGNAGTRSDANGTFSAEVTITDAWSVGTHTLTARDASNDSPHNSVSVTIVQPGQANTPGPKYLASAYQGTGHNITYNITSNFVLASVKEDRQGNISGNAIWTPPLYGSGPFTGKVNVDNSLVFTSIAKDSTGFTITFTGTVNADGSLSGNYTVSDGQIGTWQVSPA